MIHQVLKLHFAYSSFKRFLDNTGGEKKPSASILDIGVQPALNFAGFDEKMFLKRGGRYVWSKKDRELEW